MQTSVLLSIKPEFANAILDGTKKFEFRRSLFRRPTERVVLYASSPIRLVLGEFTIAEILIMKLDQLWRCTARYAGIEREYFDEYFLGLDHGHAIKVRNTRRYRVPLALRQHLKIQFPPQSFCYLN